MKLLHNDGKWTFLECKLKRKTNGMKGTALSFWKWAYVYANKGFRRAQISSIVFQGRKKQ